MAAMNPPISFTLNGRDVAAQPGETLIEVARREGVEIPHLCWTPQRGDSTAVYSDV